MTPVTPVQLAQGLYWQQLRHGQSIFRTFSRRLTESDLVSFIATTGMLETLFIDPAHREGAIAGRLVPAALTCAIIEGFQFQSLIQGVGLALLEISIKALNPVCVGDAIWATVEITEVKPTSRGNRAIVTSDVKVLNQDGTNVLSYTVKRMIAGDPNATAVA